MKPTPGSSPYNAENLGAIFTTDYLREAKTSTESFQRELLNAPCEMPAVKLWAAYSTSWKVKESIVSAAISERQMINVKSKACNPNKMEHKLTITHTDRLLWSKRLVTNWLLNAMATCK